MGQVSFGPFAFDPESGVLTRDGQAVPLGGRAAPLLEALVRAGGATVGKAELMEAGWPGVVVEEGNLSVQIAALRKLLGQRPDGTDWITTVARVGYRLPHAADPHEPKPQGTSRASIAVLPFANLSTDAEQGYFADGVVEALTTALSRFRTFAVVARNSAFVFKDRAIDVREAAKALGVRYVLEGSVQRRDRLVRVTAQLIEAETGVHLWADKLDGELDDIFDFQDRITESVVGLIEPRIRMAEIERARSKRPENLDAHDLYLQALPLVYGMDPAEYATAIDLLRRATLLDPGFALAPAYAAWTLEKRLTWGLPPLGPNDRAECMRLARAALLADSNDPVVLVILGWLSIVIESDSETGLSATRRAAAANPNNVVVLHLAGYANGVCGDLDEAMTLFERALRLSPSAPDAFGVLTGIGALNLFNGNFRAAIDWCLKSLATFNEWPITYWSLIAAYAHLDRLDEAHAAVKKLIELAPGSRASVIGASNPAKPGRFEVMRLGLIKAGVPE